MILSGEFRIHLELLSRILDFDKKAKLSINKTIIDIKSSNINYDSARTVYYLQNAISAVSSLERDSITGDVVKIAYVESIINIIISQYGISLDKFLEENYVEIPLILKNMVVYLGHSTERYGTKKCNYSDINEKISSIDVAKYSGKKLTWSSLGGFNSEYSADFY